MKSASLLTIAIFTTAFSFAQHNPSQLRYAQKVEKFGKMRNTGALLTVGGGVLFVLGVVVLANSTITTASNGGGSTSSSVTGNPELGAVEFVFGAAGLGAGIPLWIIGAKQRNKNQKRFDNASAAFLIRPSPTGIVLACRF